MKDVKNRPKHLNLLQIKQPLPAKLSILHRLSGAGLFLSIPLLLVVFNMSLWLEGYTLIRDMASSPIAKFAMILVAWAFFHHYCAGVRYLLLDIQIGIEKEAARASAILVFVVSIIMTLLFAWRVVL